MTDIQLTILRHLYLNPIEDNFTLSVLGNSIGFDTTILQNDLQTLIDNKYVVTGYAGGEEGNQYKMNDPYYRITGHGAKTLHEIDGKGLQGIIKKYGKAISWTIGIIGIIGVIVQMYFGFREDCRRREELKLQRQQLQIQQQTQGQTNQNTTLHPDNEKKNLADSIK